MNQTIDSTAWERLLETRLLLFRLQQRYGCTVQARERMRSEGMAADLERLESTEPALARQLAARELVLEAALQSAPSRARGLVEKALALDPLCPEANLAMARLSRTVEESMRYYQRCMDTSLLLLGPERMARSMEAFRVRPWRDEATLPFLKAKVGLAELLFRNGFHETASTHFEELLEWNPADDIQLRPYHCISLLCGGRLAEAARTLRQAADQLSVPWLYCRAMTAFAAQGDTPESRDALVVAYRANPWVPVLLLGMRPMPSTRLLQWRKGRRPLRRGSQLEAADSVRCLGVLLLHNERLAGWLWQTLQTYMEAEDQASFS
ncbi:MAG: hypothetical protein RLY31_2891 [Bacteroidota bacterium]|jgi:tetratricopeptide (TPR) repeat protein